MPRSSASRAEPRVVVCSGHMIDAPDRSEPRFPASKEAAVRRALAKALADLGAGASDIGICGGACGADILFGEACRERGVRALLLIALPEDEFLRRSVTFADADWGARYRALRAQCETRFQHEVLGPPAVGENVFERNNAWCLDTAYGLAPEDRVHAILVWDGRSAGDRPGGTADFASRVAQGGGSVSIIDPMKI